MTNLLFGLAALVVAAFDLGVHSLTYVPCGGESAQSKQHTIDVKPGDAFALYTDGLTEAGPDRRHLLGVEGLAQFVREHDGGAHAMVEPVISPVEAYADGSFHDDVCLLVGIVLDK